MLLADKEQTHYLHYMHFQEMIQEKFYQLGKATWLKIFMTYGCDKIGALEQLLIVNETSEQQLAMPASFVCDAYCPECIEINSIPELRRYMFCKHMAESNRLSPTSRAKNSTL